MGLLEKLFGGGVSVEKLRKAVVQKRFADAKLFAEQLTEQSLNEAAVVEVEQLRVIAGDELARLNLSEALGMQRCGKFEQAAEHLQLAQEQVCSAELRKEIEQAIVAEPLVPEVDSLAVDGETQESGRSTSLLNDDEEMPGDVESRLELILTSYPVELAERYCSKGEVFKEAFLLSHAGQDDQALPVWQQVSPVERDDLYWFELGSLFARTGHLEDARSALETALEQNPDLLLAIEALTPILVATGEFQLAEERLKKFLSQELNPQFCHAQLASLYVQQQKFSAAGKQARQALAAGNTDPEFMLLAAAVLEHIGALEEAENVLKKLPVAGYGGGISLPLAEFWLRWKRELNKILDTFNTACRKDPENPRWQLRVAQTCLALHWTKDGLKLLRKVVNDPQLEPELVQEAEQLLADFCEPISD